MSDYLADRQSMNGKYMKALISAQLWQPAGHDSSVLSSPKNKEPGITATTLVLHCLTAVTHTTDCFTVGIYFMSPSVQATKLTNAVN